MPIYHLTVDRTRTDDFEFQEPDSAKTVSTLFPAVSFSHMIPSSAYAYTEFQA